jgi:hypothetical protein
MNLIQSGLTLTLAGNYDAARDALDEGTVLFTEIGETTWTSLGLRYKGLLALLEGDPGEAERFIQTSLAEGQEQAPQWDLASWIDELAAVAAAKGDSIRAATLWGAAEALYEQLGLVVLEENRQVRERFRPVAERTLNEQTWTASWKRGHEMARAGVLAYALGTT